MTQPGNILKYIMSVAIIMFIAVRFFAFDAKADEQGEVTYGEPEWRFGLAGAANLNFYEGTTHRLTDNLLLPGTFHEGFGFKPYFAGLVEYRFNEMWGITMNLGYDARGGVFDDITLPCNLPAELETNLSYLAIEPSIRFAPFRNGFHLFAGPRFSINMQNEFEYRREIQHTNPVEFLEEEDEWSELNDNLLSVQIGAGYDFMLSSPSKQTKYILTPFVSFHPYFGQVPRNIESWSITTVRAGVALKIGRGVPTELPVDIVEPDEVVDIVEPKEPTDVEVVEPEITEPPVTFNVRPPILEQRTITNVSYPVRNYIFFEKDSRSIPDRYVMLSPTEARRFSEEELLQRIITERRSTSDAHMLLYYNLLNILGDRMRIHQNTSITLQGASAGQGAEAGRRQAEAIKDYLVTAFNIAPARITTRGTDWPVHRSFRHEEQAFADLRLDSDRRVEITSTSPELMVVYNRQPSTLIKPAVTTRSDADRLDSHIIFNLTNAERYMDNWYVLVTDPQGLVIKFGPFTGSQESISATDLLAKGAEGRYNAVMRGVSKEGLEFSRETTFELFDREIIERNIIHFNLLYEFEEFEVSSEYEQYFVNEVVPLIGANSRIVIQGHADMIGDPDYNKALSLLRAQNAKKLVERALAAHRISGVVFEVYGFGEVTEESPFPNTHPEHRFNNRTVIIEVLPQ